MTPAYAHPDDATRALQRVLAIHRLLAAGEAVAKPALADRFQVTTKTIQRDLAALKREGAPLVYDRVRKGHVYAKPGWSFEGPSLSDHEQFALMVAESALAQYEGTDLHAGLAAAFERIGARLPEPVRARHRHVSDAIHFGGLPPPPIDPDVWDALLLAIQSRSVVQIDYAKLGQPATTRELHPYQLLARDRDWFLVAHLPTRRRELLFYLPRIRAVRLQSAGFEPRPGFDPAAFHGQGFNAMQGPTKPVTVELRFTPEAADLAGERPWAHDQQLKRHRDGSVSLRFKSAALFEVKRQVLRYEGRVQVVRPAALRREVAATARAVARAHKE
jgi:predicted DNA-binding transcriptional regulator YafY